MIATEYAPWYPIRYPLQIMIFGQNTVRMERISIAFLIMIVLTWLEKKQKKIYFHLTGPEILKCSFYHALVSGKCMNNFDKSFRLR